MPLLDLFDDEAPPAPPTPLGDVHPPRAAGVPVPTYREHPCSIAGCGEWGCYGLMGDDIAESEWRCRGHVWPGFLPANRAPG